MAEWTKDPKETGAYWYKFKGALQSMTVLVKDSMVYGVDGLIKPVNHGYTHDVMYYGPLDQPPPMPSEAKPVIATPEPEKQVNPTAHEAAVAWAQSQARQFTDTTGAGFGKAVAEVYKACLAEIEGKAVPIGGVFDYFDPRTQVGVNVRQTHANRTGSDGMAGKGL